MIQKAITQLAKNGAIYGLSGMLQRFIGFLLLPFFTKILTTQDYGVFAMVSLIGIAINGLLSLGTSNSNGILFFRKTKANHRSEVIWTNFILLIGNGIFWYLFLYTIAPQISSLIFQTNIYSSLIRLFIIGTVLNSITNPLLSYLRYQEQAKKYATLTLLGSFVTSISSVYFILIMKIGIKGLILSSILGSTTTLMLTFIVVIRETKFLLNSSLIFPLVKIGFPSIFGLFAFLLIDYADRQMIERFIGLSELGIYSIGYGFGMVMNLFVGAFGEAWSPFFISYTKKTKEAKQIFGNVLTYYLLSFGSLVTMFFIFAKPIVLLITAPSFHECWLIVGLVSAGYFFKGCYLIFLPGIYFAEKLKYQSIIEWIAAFLNIILNLLLIPIFGLLGAAISTLLSYMILPVLAWYYSRSYLKVDYNFKRLASILTTIMFTIVIAQALSVTLTVNLFIQTTICFSILSLYFLFTYFFLFKEEERKLFKEKISFKNN